MNWQRFSANYAASEDELAAERSRAVARWSEEAKARAMAAEVQITHEDPEYLKHVHVREAKRKGALT